MLDEQDVRVLQGMFRENNEVLIEKITGDITGKMHVMERNIRDEIDSKVSACERRLEAKIDDKIDGLRNEIVDLIDEHILPQIAELQLKIA